MNNTRLVATLVLIGGFLLSGCGADEPVNDQTSGQSVTTETTSEDASAEDLSTAAASTETEEESGDVRACNLLFDEDASGDSISTRIPPAILAIGPSLGNETLDELLAINSTLGLAATLAEEPLSGQITTLQEPFQQVRDVVDAGGGDLTIDTSHVTEDMTAIMETCVAAGYQMND